MSAPACASRWRRWRPRSSASRSAASPSSTAIRRAVPNSGGTGGSTGLTRGGVAVRQAAATARQELLARASAQLGVRPQTSRSPTAWSGRRREDEAFRSRGWWRPGRIAGWKWRSTRRRRSRPRQPTSRSGSPRRGRTSPRSAPDATFISRISPCPACATAASCGPRRSARARLGQRVVDRASARRRVVRHGNFLAVVAGDEWAALRAARELDARWTEAHELPGHDNLERYLRDGVVDREQVFVERGTADDSTRRWAPRR